MLRKLAIKKLKASDLSFFSAYLEENPTAKQKAFNLSAEVIEAQLYPDLSSVIAGMPDQRSPVGLTFVGPGKAPPYFQMRKVLKQQKNWRLNGEVVKAPEDDPTRFDDLRPGDIAIMEFSGAGAPNDVKVLLLSAGNAEDAKLHAVLDEAFSQAMAVVSEEQIERVIQTAGPAADHPIRDWLDRNVLEEIGRGSAEAVQQLAQRRKSRGLTRGELQRAKSSAEAVGRLGEELLDYHLSNEHGTHAHATHVWVAEANAISPYDFDLTLHDGSKLQVDAKSTAGPFSNPIHLSLAEVQHALASGVPYSIYRLYEVTDTDAKVRVAHDIAAQLKPLQAALLALPVGVKIDSLSFNPDYFVFDTTEIAIQFDDEPED